MKEIFIDKLIEKVVEISTEITLNVTQKNYKGIKAKFNSGFKEYLVRAYRKYSKIKTLLYRTEPKYIYDFFECNDLKYGNKKIDASDINNILKISNFIIINGNGGIGKTTLMKHFFISELQKEKLIPIFFELKDYDDSIGDLKYCIYNSIYNLGCKIEEKYFDIALEKGRFLILLDGYDEISSTKIDNFHRELNQLCDKYSDNSFIMSSRPNENNFIDFQRFSVLESIEFSKQKAINLVKKLDYDKDTKERFLVELKNNLYDKHKSFASNPLLLTIMLLTYNDYAEIPDKLHVFYAEAFDTLYTKHDATKSGYKRELQANLSKDVFIKVFSRFCFQTYMISKIEFAKTELYDNFNKIKRSGLDFDNEKFLSDLENAICLIYKDGLSYRFTHRSFQEYFTAKYISELSDEMQQMFCNELIQNRTFDTVLNMLYDMSRERFEKNVLIPYIEKIEESCTGKKNRYEIYYRAIFSKIIMSKYNDKKVNIGIEIKDIFLFDFISRHLIEKNIKYYDEEKENFFFKKYAEKKGKKIANTVSVEITINEILKDEQLFNYINKKFKHVELLMSMLENLKKRQAILAEDLYALLD